MKKLSMVRRVAYATFGVATWPIAMGWVAILATWIGCTWGNAGYVALVTMMAMPFIAISALLAAVGTAAVVSAVKGQESIR